MNDKKVFEENVPRNVNFAVVFQMDYDKLKDIETLLQNVGDIRIIYRRASFNFLKIVENMAVEKKTCSGNCGECSCKDQGGDS